MLFCCSHQLLVCKGVSTWSAMGLQLVKLYLRHTEQIALVQSPTERPTFDDIKTDLAKIASETFNCSPEWALQTRRAKQQALLNQMLPSKV